MTESLRPVRAVAAWILVAYVGLTEAGRVLDWVLTTQGQDPLYVMLRTSPPSIFSVVLLAAAVVISGVVAPRIMGARPIALIAFIQCGVLLVLSAIYAAASFVHGFPTTVDEYVPFVPSVNLQQLIAIAAALAFPAVGAFFAWRVYVATDVLSHEISELAGQIATLDEDVI